MKFTIPILELKTLVTGFAKVVPTKPSLPVLGTVRLDTQDGSLVAQATNLDETVSYRFENAHMEGTGTLVVPFTLLRDLSKGDPSETVTLSPVDAQSVSVTSHVGGHAVTSTAPCIDPEDWPDVGGDVPTTEAKGFLAAFRRVARFVHPDATRPVLSGVLVDGKGKGTHNATLVATDGRRMTCCNSLDLFLGRKDKKDGKSGWDDVIVPVSKFLVWKGLPDEGVGFGVVRDNAITRICIKVGPWTYATRTINGRYPDWRQVIPDEEDMVHQIRFTDSEVEALRKILPMLPGGKGIVLEGGHGKLNLSTADDTGKPLTVPLTAGSTYTGPGCRLILDRRYLLDALNVGFRNFGFAGPAVPVLSQDGKGGMHVLMPLCDDPVKASTPDPVDVSTPAEPEAPVTPTQSVTPETSVTPIPPITHPETPKTPEHPQEKYTMNTENTKHQTAPEPSVSALEALQASFESAKAKLRETQSALVEVGASLREAHKEERQRRNEAESVRSTLRKLQSIRV